MPFEIGTSSQLTFTCPLPSGMHARPATMLAEVSNRFRSEIALINHRNERRGNGKSVLSIIAADIRSGDRCSIVVSGNDETAAHAAIREFIEQVLPKCDGVVPAAAPGANPKLPRVLRNTDANYHFGLPASSGIGKGNVVVARSRGLPSTFTEQTQTAPDEELERLQLAMRAVRERIRTQIFSSTELGNAILNTHLAILDDVLLAQQLAEHISGGKSAGYAIVKSGKDLTTILRQSGNEYLRERAVDVEEILARVMEQLYGSTAPKNSVQEKLHGESILVAETIGPSQLLDLNSPHLKGIVLEQSGTTSHAVLLAQSLGVATVVGVRNACALLSGVADAVVDGRRGLVISPVTPAIEGFYQRELHVSSQRQALLVKKANSPAVTQDGQGFEVGANASSLDDVVAAFENGAEGIGLFRTEIAFLRQDIAPTEEQLFSFYRDALRAAQGRPVLLRTLDVGGDKPVPFLNLPRENNAFLGYRGARIYGEHRDLLQTQLRAMLCASVYGRIQIMAPMISSLHEVRAFKNELEKAKQEVQKRNSPMAENIPVGIMIEVPSTAFILDQLCSEVDFFSIGTNDLAQYFLAVDRENVKVATLFDVLHPGFIRLLQKIVAEIHQAGKWVGLCGDMAAERRNLPLLLGLGLDEISVPPRSVPELKDAAGALSSDACKEIVGRISAARDRQEIEALLVRTPSNASALPLLSHDLIKLKSDSATKEEAIQELVDAVYMAARCNDRQQLEDAVWAREEVYSTGLGFGFATPHCKTDAVTANSIGVLKLKHAIRWGTADNEPVRMVILIAMREQNSANDHMQVFSELARKLMNEAFREQLFSFQDAIAMVHYLRKELSL